MTTLSRHIVPRDLTLHRAGYLRCTFGFDPGERCDGCDRVPGQGAPMYWISTSHECDDGDYYCRRCAYDRALGRGYDLRPVYLRNRPMHGAGWAYLHGMQNWETIYWSQLL